VLATSQLLDFYRRPSELLEILTWFPITIGRKIVLVDIIVVDGPLDFNMFLMNDYVYYINSLVSTTFM
jgi:hypothetical protein